MDFAFRAYIQRRWGAFHFYWFEQPAKGPKTIIACNNLQNKRVAPNFHTLVSAAPVNNVGPVPDSSVFPDLLSTDFHFTYMHTSICTFVRLQTPPIYIRDNKKNRIVRRKKKLKVLYRL